MIFRERRWLSSGIFAWTFTGPLTVQLRKFPLKLDLELNQFGSNGMRRGALEMWL